MEGFEVQPHTLLSKKDVPAVVLVVEDPMRAELIAKTCDSHQEIAFNREYRSFECVKDGQRFLVASHGTGSAGAAICFEEIIYCGAQVMISVCVARKLSSKLKCGDVVLCEAAVRDETTSVQYIPQVFPAVTDIGVYEKLRQAASSLKLDCKSGYTLSSDAFYPSKSTVEKFKLYAESNISTLDMQVSTLFVLGKLRGIRTAALCCVEGSPPGLPEEYVESREALIRAGTEAVDKIAICACVSLTKELS